MLTNISRLCTCRSSIYDNAHHSEIPYYQAARGKKVDLAGVEKQRITLVMSITEGCNVELR
jgi:hypothetical protein